MTDSARITDSTTPDGSTKNLTEEQKAETADAAEPRPDTVSEGAPTPPNAARAL